MPLIDPAKDTVAGKWQLNGAGELASDDAGEARLAVPYRPPAEYDLRIAFTLTAGSHGMKQILVGQGRQFVCGLGDFNNRAAHFETVDGRCGQSNPTTVTRDAWLQTGRRHESLVQVRKGSVKAFLDGAFATELKTDFRNVGLPNSWNVKDATLLGLASFQTGLTFHRVEVVEISGPGTFTRPHDPAAKKVAQQRAASLSKASH